MILIELALLGAVVYFVVWMVKRRREAATKGAQGAQSPARPGDEAGNESGQVVEAKRETAPSPRGPGVVGGPWAPIPASLGLDASRPSLRDESGFSARCVHCGQPVSGYGAAGGLCVACQRWSYDREQYRANREAYGEGGETLMLLAGYENARLRGEGMELQGRLWLTPGQLLFAVSNGPGGEEGVARIRFCDIVFATATRGERQQLTLLQSERRPAYGIALPSTVNIDLCGRCYDRALGCDLMRVQLLIDQYKKERA